MALNAGVNSSANLCAYFYREAHLLIASGGMGKAVRMGIGIGVFALSRLVVTAGSSLLNGVDETTRFLYGSLTPGILNAR
jgi:hypothetical protein